MNNEIKKVKREDLEIKKGKIEVDCVVIDGKTINLTPVNYQSIEKYITHEDCADCGAEFAKRFTYDRKCSVCQSLDEILKYNELPLVEWDGESALALYNDDVYFFDYESIEEYCEENETEISSLLLVVCERSHFGHIDYEHFADNVHEDWEPSTEMKDKLEEFNKFLDSQSTNTWFPKNKRVDLTDFRKEVSGE